MMAHIIAARYSTSIAPRYAPLSDSGFPIQEMKTVEEVRRERLGELRKEFGSLVALNEKLGLTARDATLSQILNSAKNSRTGTPKQMGSKLAREIEAACGKEIGWMDTDPALLSGSLTNPEVAALAAAIDALPDTHRDFVVTTAQLALDRAKDLLGENNSQQPVESMERPSPKRGKVGR